MEKVIEKLDEYNILNYLLPGIIFILLLKEYANVNLPDFGLLEGIFLYYFSGLVISRIGSLIIHPLLMKIKFIKFEQYADYINASNKDPKLELFSRENNMYRTFISTFFLLLLFKGCAYIIEKMNISKELCLGLFVVLLLFIFLASYKKQTKIISSRIKNVR